MADWRAQGERSTLFWLRLIVYFARRAPRKLVRVLLYPTVLYFMFAGGGSQAASTDYLRRVLKREPTWRHRWRHFFSFASCTLDRAFLLGNNFSGIRLEVHRDARIMPLVDAGRGCLLIVAHFGSAEVLRFGSPPTRQDPGASSIVARATHIKTTILLDREHGGRMLVQLLESLNPDMALDIVDAAERGPQLVLKLKEALQSGRMVCVTGDRVAAGESFVKVDFLDGRARFAATPWILAAALQVPVLLGFGLYQGGNRYVSHLELFAERISLPRGERRTTAMTELAQRYASRLEHYVRLHPYNWFNFYDYWSNDTDGDASP